MPNTVVDTATGESRPVEVGPVNTLSFSTTAPPPQPAASLGDVAQAKLRQMQPLPTHDTSTNIPTAPVPAHLPNQPMPFVRASTPVERANSAISNAYEAAGNMGRTPGEAPGPLQVLGQAAGFDPKGVLDQFRTPEATMGAPIAGGDPEFTPLRGFFSRFETEVIPRLPKIAQNPKTISNLVEKFVPKEQWEWMGGPAWLESLAGKSVTKADVEAWFKDHQPTFFEHWRGAPPQGVNDAAAAIRDAAREKANAAFRDAQIALNAEHARLSATEPDNTRLVHIDEALGALHNIENYGGTPNVEAIRAKYPEVGDVAQAYADLNSADAALSRSGRGHAAPKWQQYTEPGGTNYHERLVVAPQKPIPSDAIAPTVWQPPTRVENYRGGVNGGMRAASEGPATVHAGANPVLYDSHANVVDFTDHPAFANEPRKFQTPNGEIYHTLNEAKAAVEESAREQAENQARKELSYSHSHFSDVPDYFFHQRMKEREVEDVGKTLFSEEDQSDAHHAGRYNGYRQLGDRTKANDASRAADLAQRVTRNEAEAAGNGKHALNMVRTYAHATTLSPTEIVAEVQKSGSFADTESAITYAQRAREAADAHHNEGLVALAPPDMPFKKSWPELGLRMQLRDAVDRGADAIGWTTGQQQINRYGRTLNETVGRIQLQASFDSNDVRIEVSGKQGQPLTSQHIDSPDDISDMVGKTEAKRLFAQPRIANANGFVQTLNYGPDSQFRMGGEGHVQFYDKQRVALAEKIGKEYGTKPELVEMQERVPKPSAMAAHSWSRNAENPWMDANGHVIDEPPEDYEPDYDNEPVMPDEDPRAQMENFEPSYNYPHWVNVDADELKNNAEDINEVLDHIRAAHPDIFGHPAAQQDLVSDIGGSPDTALRSGVHFEVRDVPTSYSGTTGRGAGTDYEIMARFSDGTERRIAGSDDAEFEDEADAIAIARQLQTGGEAEPTKWRYEYSEDGHSTEQSDWYDNPDDATSAAEEKRQELDDAAYQEEYDARYSELRAEHRNAAREHEDWERQEEERREQWHAARDEWERQGGQEWNGEAESRVVPKAKPKDDNTQLVSRGQVWIMKIPEAMKAALKKNGQPLPSIAVPLTGAGLSLMASHKRQQEAR